MSEAARDAGPDAGFSGTAGPWYVALTKPRAEEQARSQLLNQGYEVWLPLLVAWRKSAGEWLRKEAPFFPRYLFVRPAHAGQSIAPIRSTLGVSALVRFGAEPARLGEVLLDELRRVVDAYSRHPDLQRSPFAAGEAVHVSGGPLAGLDGIVTRPALERVTVLLHILGRQKEVAFDPSMLAKCA